MNDSASRFLSPGHLARAVGVSESSVRRWVDDGLIGVTKTAGGHRRIAVTDALRFVRAQRMRILRPELLGLSGTGPKGPGALGELSTEKLYELLTDARGAEARSAILDAYLNGTTVAALCDGPLSGALRPLGELWSEDPEGICLEHIGTSICIEALSQLRTLIPTSDPLAPLAMGGAPEWDAHFLPSLMAATVLADAGYRDVNLGAFTPSVPFLDAARRHGPALVWLAVTSAVDERSVARLTESLLEPLLEMPLRVVVGGEAALERKHAWPEGVTLLRSMAELETFALEYKMSLR